MAGALLDLFDEVRASLTYDWEVGARKDDLDAMRGALAAVVGTEVTLDGLLAAKRERSSYFASAGRANLVYLARRERTNEWIAEAFNEWHEFVDESNLRAIFNLRVAGLIGLPYAPNTTRIPMRGHQLANAQIAHRQFLDVAEIQLAVDTRTARYLRPTSVPFQSSSRPRCTRRVRLRTFGRGSEAAIVARPYRAHRNELISALELGDGRAIDRIATAVAADVRAWRKLISPKVVLGLGVTLLSTGLGLAAQILTTMKLFKAASETDDSAREGLIRRVLRRDEWFLTRSGDTASQLTNGLAKVDAIWHPDKGTLDRCANRLATLKTADASLTYPAGLHKGT